MLKWMMKQSRRGRRRLNQGGSGVSIPTTGGSCDRFLGTLALSAGPWRCWASQGKGAVQRVVDDSGRRSPTGVVFLAPSRARALCPLGLPDLSTDGGPRGQASTFSLSMFAGWTVWFASTLTGCADVPLSMREGGCSGRSLSLQGRHQSDVSVDLRRAGRRGCRVLGCGRSPGLTLPTRFFGNAGRRGTHRPERAVVRAPESQKDTAAKQRRQPVSSWRLTPTNFGCPAIPSSHLPHRSE